MQAHRAAHAPLPEFGDLDLTGHYGVDAGGHRALEVAVVGDSTLTGPGLDHAREVFVAQAASRMRVPLHLTRYAVGGSRVADVLMHQLPRVLDARPDLVVISVGANDAVHSTPLAQFERDLRAVVGALDRLGSETLLCGLIDLSVIPRIPATMRPLLRRRGDAYERRKARAVQGARTTRHLAVGRRVNEVFRAHGPAFFTDDRFHPNGHGHRCLADVLAPQLEGAIARVLHRRREAAVLAAAQ